MSQRVQDLCTERDFEELLDSAQANAANDWEESFVRDMRERYQSFGRRMYLSEAQKDHLERIAADE